MRIQVDFVPDNSFMDVLSWPPSPSIGYAVSDSARLKTIQFSQRFVVCLCTKADYTVYCRPA